MKYFTKAWYEEMQVSGSLVFPETEQDWEEDVAWYKAQGMDFETMAMDNLEYMKSDLLKYLPRSFHPYILDGTLKKCYPSPELRRMAEQWRCDYESRMNALAAEYRNYYLSVKDTLPSGVVKVYEHSLHDARVISYESPSEDSFNIILDCRGGYHYHTDIMLSFSGVREIKMNEPLECTYWLYDEVYAADYGFELHVLLNGTCEFTICAENVSVQLLGTPEV